MNFKIGTDIVEIDRIKKSMEKDRFCKTLFSEKELEYYAGHGMKPESIAGAFCAKEAFSKALGTGMRGLAWSDIRVLHNELGKPYFELSGSALEAAGRLNFDLSITHDKTTAQAVVIAWEE